MVEGFYIMLKLNNFLQVEYKMKVFFLLFKSQKVHFMHTNGRGLGKFSSYTEEKGGGYLHCRYRKSGAFRS